MDAPCTARGVRSSPHAIEVAGHAGCRSSSLQFAGQSPPETDCRPMKFPSAPGWNRTSMRLLPTVPKTAASSIFATGAFVRPTGFEPARALAHQPLKLACLPRLHHGRVRADDRIRTCTGSRPPRAELGVSTKNSTTSACLVFKVPATRIELARAQGPVDFKSTASTFPPHWQACPRRESNSHGL